MYTEAVLPILKAFSRNETDETGARKLSTNRFERRALELLREWNGATDETNSTAALAILSFRPIFQANVLDRDLTAPGAVKTFREAVAFLVKHYGRVDVPLGEVQRLRRGAVDLPIGGGPDILNATHAKLDGGQMIGWAGDSHILFVEFYPDGPRGSALHQFGNVNRPDSPHYADQAALFTRRTLRRSLFSEADLRERTARAYHPGQSD